MSEALKQFLEKNVTALREQGLYNEIDTVETPNGPVIKMNGKEQINLSSNNYLGLATDERLKEAAITAVKEWGSERGCQDD